MNRVGAEGHPSPLSGAKPFGKYYLLDRIGAGGMAEVFRAIAIGPEGFQRTMVIKRMLPNLSQDPAFVRMFVDEAKLCGLLSHPNLVQIFEFGMIEESFFIAMEHVQGETLLAVQKKLAEAGRVAPVAASLEIVRQVCVGLHYAHSLQSATGQPLGIIHRDITPSNLMLSAHGGVKILDFGIARVAEELRETHTQAGTMKGKVSYMSPEQIRMDKVDSRADIFAVGIVLHELLTGRRLFRATNEFNSARMVLESVVPRPSTVNPEVPVEVDEVVMRALERHPDARYLTAGEMADDIEKRLSEMRASPHEPRKLLLSLFPQRLSYHGDVMLPFPPAPSVIEASSTPPRSPWGPSPTSASHATKPLASGVAMGVEIDLSTGSPVSRRRGGRRKWGALGALAGIVVAVVVLANPPWVTAPREVTVAHVAAQAVAPPSPEPPPSPPAKAAVEISLDSNPQDAQVVREDSGEVVGRTPMTITLPQAHDVISFRFEKPGHAPTSYKVIPDLDKAVRAELTAEPAGEAKSVPASSRRRSPSSRGREAPAPRETRSSPAAEAPAVAEQARSCLVSVGSFPWAELWIDGKDTGQRTPVVQYPVTCGPHKLALKRRDLKLNHVEQVTVAPGHALKQHYDLSEETGE
jgi:eukaryotic-like serine/threonine-protein kinase